MPYKDTVGDFNLKWGASYALHEGQLVYVYGAFFDKEGEEDETKYYVQLGKENKGKDRIYGFDLESLTPILVDSQFFNAVDLDGPSALKNNMMAAMLISRSPRRQNKRSISDENTTISTPMWPVVRLISNRWPNGYRISFDVIRMLLAERFPPYYMAFDYCKTHGAVALSKDFAIGLSSISEDKYLFMSQFGFIGEADLENIYVKHKGSFQEVLDFVSRHRLKVRVIDATNAN